jgi:hypothetical protein
MNGAQEEKAPKKDPGIQEIHEIVSMMIHNDRKAHNTCKAPLKGRPCYSIYL